MKHELFLQKLGLTPRESIVYLTLLQHGQMGVSDISRKCGLYRTDIYLALGRLIEEGLATVLLKGKYRAYKAAPPKTLEKKFLELASSFDEEIDALCVIEHTASGDRPVINYVEGQKGITDIHDDIVTTLKKGDVYYRYSSSVAAGIEKRPNYLSKKYRVLRDQKQLERKIITNAAYKAIKHSRLEREIKVVPSDFDLFEFNISQIIYGDKVAVIDYNTETAVVIENKTIAKFQAKIFELLFRKL